MHARQVEEVQTGGIAVGGGTEGTRSLDGEGHQAVVGRTEIAVLVHHADGEVGQVLAVGRELHAVGHHFQVMGLAGRAHNLLFGGAAVLVVSHDFQFTGFVGYVHPHQAVAALQPQSILFLQRKRCFRIQFTLLSVALPVDEEFSFGVAGVDKDGSDLPFPTGPGPVGQHVQGVVALVPQATVEVVAVFGQAGEVDDAEHGAMAGPCVGVVG